MHEWLRLVVLVVLGGGAVTLAAAAIAWTFTEDKRLARAFRQGLGARPDAALVAHGSGCGVALSLATQRIVTAWDAGAWRMTYPLDELLGAELDLDGEVAARVMRGEPRRLLDRANGAAQAVRLRLLFDDARHPDFELTLWPSQAPRGGPPGPREAVAEANRWIARIEAVLRRTGGALVLGKAATPAAPVPPRPAPPAASRPKEPDFFDQDAEDADDLDWDEDEGELAD
jgi:hypothetical protein